MDSAIKILCYATAYKNSIPIVRYKESADCMIVRNQNSTFKAQVFWEGHKKFPLLLTLLSNWFCYYLSNRCLMVSTNQADSCCFYFRISWILMERRWFYFFRPLHLVQGLRSLKHWLLQKLSMKFFEQKFRFLTKK